MFKVYDYSRVKISGTFEMLSTETEKLRKSLELDNVFTLHHPPAKDVTIVETRVTKYSNQDPYDAPKTLPFKR